MCTWSFWRNWGWGHRKNIWKNGGQILLKFDKNYKSTDMKNPNKPQSQETWRKLHQDCLESVIRENLRSIPRKITHYKQRNKDEDGSRFLIRNNAWEGQEQHLASTERRKKSVNLELHVQRKYLTKIKQY